MKSFLPKLLLAALVALTPFGGFSALKTNLVSIGASANDGTGTPNRTAWKWANTNLTDLDSRLSRFESGTNDAEFETITATSLLAPGISTNVLYVSQWGGIRVTNTQGIGVDSGVALQIMFDSATNKPGLEIVLDGKFITAQTLVIHSNTKLRGLTPDCGLVLSNACNQWLLVNDLNGNVYANSNIVIQGMTFYGTGSSQNRHIDATSPYWCGLYAPVNSFTESALNTGGGVDYWDPWMFCVWLSGVDGLTIRDVNFDNSRVFALTLGGAVKNAVVENLVLKWDGPIDGSQDGVHVFGYVDNLKIKNVWSNGDDDTIALNVDELAYITNAPMQEWRGTNGGFNNVIVEDIYHEGSVGGIIRLLAYNETYGKQYATNLTIKNLKGKTTATSIVRAPVGSTWGGKNLYITGLTIRDVETFTDGATGIDLVGVSGTTLNIDNVVSYLNPSSLAVNNNNVDWAADRFTPGYIQLDHSWSSASIQNCHFFTKSGATNYAMVSVRYPFGWPGIKNLSIANSSISGPGIRAVVANHGYIDTLSFSGVTTTNRLPIPGTYSAKSLSSGGATPMYIGQTYGTTNFAEDTTLWLRRVRQIGYEPTPSRVRAVDWGLQFLQNSGDLANIQEIGFFAGATNIAEVLPKIRTYWTNEWVTNSFHVNYGFTSSMLVRNGLLLTNGTSYLDAQTPISTLYWGSTAAPYTNYSAGVYVLGTTNFTTRLIAGGSWSATGDSDRFGWNSKASGDPNSPTIWNGNFFYGPIFTADTTGMQAVVSTNSVTRRVYQNGVSVNNATTWNGQGWQTGTFWLGKGQNYSGPTNELLSLWYLGNGAVNQSNINYAARIMTEMAACYSPAPIYATGWTNYFGTVANVLVTGGANVGVTNQFGQTVADLAATTNVTFTLKPGWIIGGSGMTGVATDL